MSDLIDREAAVDALTKCAETYKRDWDKWDSAEAFGGYCGIGSAISEIEELPSVQQWIPCSERLPERNQNVLFQGVMQGMYVGQYQGDHDNENVWFCIWQNNRFQPVKCIAWMSLPEPYKGDECSR